MIDNLEQEIFIYFSDLTECFGFQKIVLLKIPVECSLYFHHRIASVHQLFNAPRFRGKDRTDLSVLCLRAATYGTGATATRAVSAAACRRPGGAMARGGGALVYGVRSPVSASGVDVRSRPQPPASSSLMTAPSESEGV
jgi:hypothetical protein